MHQLKAELEFKKTSRLNKSFHFFLTAWKGDEFLSDLISLVGNTACNQFLSLKCLAGIV